MFILDTVIQFRDILTKFTHNLEIIIWKGIMITFNITFITYIFLFPLLIYVLPGEIGMLLLHIIDLIIIQRYRKKSKTV